MTTSDSSPIPPAGPLPGGQGPRGGISPRKVVLGVILAGSIFLFFFILFSGGLALVREAAPVREADLARLLIAFRHVVARHILQIVHHK